MRGPIRPRNAQVHKLPVGKPCELSPSLGLSTYASSLASYFPFCEIVFYNDNISFLVIQLATHMYKDPALLAWSRSQN